MSETTEETMSDRLSEIEGRLAAATPGPWELGEVTPMPDGWPGFYADVEPNIGGGLDPHDADLIAHAPADLAALVAFARTVEAANDRYLRGEVGGVQLSMDVHAAVQSLGGA